MAPRRGISATVKLLKDKLVRARLGLLRRLYSKERLLGQVEYRSCNFIVPINEDVGGRLVVFREYERDEIECLEQLIRKDDVCIDVGANIGIFSLFMARKAWNGQVIAFEPLALNRDLLSANAALNGVNNIEVCDCVLSDVVGGLSFSVSEDPGYSSIRPTDRKREAFSLNAQSNTLDNLFREERQRVDVIKVDVEGAELLVLQGGETLLSTPQLRPRALLVELNAQNQSVYNYEPEDVVKYMDTLNYSAYPVTGRGLEKGWPRKGCTEDVLFVYAGRI